MEGLARGRIATHVRHVASDRDGRDSALSQPVFKTGAGEASGKCLLNRQVVRALGNLRVKLPGFCAFAKKRRVGPFERVLNQHGWNPALRDPSHSRSAPDVRPDA